MTAATQTPTPRHTSKRRILRRVVGVVLLLLLVLIGASALSNLFLPGRSQLLDRLPALEKARVAEAIHLRQTLGSSIWPGWGEAAIPVIVYNEEYAFLVGYPDPPDGWVKVPQNLQRGGPWEEVPGDTFEGQTYYRQKLPGQGVTPEAFAVLVGDRWAAGMPAREWFVIGLGEQISESLPGPLAAVLPYRLLGRILAGSSDQYVTLVLHESFHAYQGIKTPARLAASENASRLQESNYPWDDPALQESWQAELNLLADAARAASDEQARDLARRFLARRDDRRTTSNLPPALVNYEQQREWLEGLAKYTELSIWRQAAATPSYAPLPALLADPDFKRYTGAGDRWSQEIDQATRMAGDEGDGRFYYSGMLQASLLDRLSPSWRELIWPDPTWLEDLLRQSLE
jgi:hypothetical protein